MTLTALTTAQIAPIKQKMMGLAASLRNKYPNLTHEELKAMILKLIKGKMGKSEDVDGDRNCGEG